MYAQTGNVLLAVLAYTFLVAAAYLVATRDKTKVSTILEYYKFLCIKGKELKGQIAGKAGTQDLEQMRVQMANVFGEAYKEVANKVSDLEKKVEWLTMVQNAKTRSVIHTIKLDNIEAAEKVAEKVKAKLRKVGHAKRH